MMTSDEINAAIKRLKNLVSNNYKMDAFEVMKAAFGAGTPWDYCDALIGLLQQVDPDTHIELPKDADGIPLHVGDDVYARCESATHGHHYYFNGKVNTLEFDKDGTYSYVTTDDEDGDQFKTCELHHGSHIPTSGQIVEDLVDEAYNLGADKERANERYSNTAWEARKELVKRLTEQLKPLLSDDAE